ncbi:MAG: hypothetical protein ACSI46_06500 [Gloeotrichia echinulata DVL01]|jgi:hypothetical protein|nr:hypothetical protein [Gloeotrichia echinulata DEX184]
MIGNSPIHLGTGADAMPAGSWYDDAYYQILLVEPCSKIPGRHIKTTIIVGQRQKSTGDTKDFSTYKLDQNTINKLTDYPKPPDFDKDNISIGTYLPSPGVFFPEGFIQSLKTNNSLNPIELNNFYETTRSQLQTRKVSQLIAKTWNAYLDAKKNPTPCKKTLWDSFKEGEWDLFDNNKCNINILDGLIAREIFLAEHNTSSDHLEPGNLNIYYPLKSQFNGQHTRFLISPNSKAWEGITLSLLLAGQAYYKIGTAPGLYHQISQPILSTGEIVIRYGVNVSWDRFKGELREQGLISGNNSIAYQVIIPYPPIPSEENLNRDELKQWADAEDDPDTNVDKKLPFYHKDNQGNYLVDAQYFSPPYPYIPLSTCS